MNDRVTVPGCNGIVEGQVTDVAPIGKRPPLPKSGTGGPSFVGDLYIERQRSFWKRISTVEYLRQDFVAKVEVVPRDLRLVRMHDQAHELRRPRRGFRGLAKLGDRIQLTDGRLFVDPAKGESGEQKNWHAAAAP